MRRKMSSASQVIAREEGRTAKVWRVEHSHWSRSIKTVL